MTSLMSLPFLATKFHIPPARPEMVARPRLLTRLLAGIERPQSFTLLSGPAGSGKTTLLSQFTAHVDWPVAWLSLDESDNDASRFWAYLISAVQSALPEVGESALALLETAQPLPADTLPTLLINDIAGQDGQLLLLLDDYHLIQTPSIHEGLAFLVDHLPHNLHLGVATRVDPPWPLHRYRVRNRLVELRAADLRFNQEETVQFLNQTMGLQIAPEDVAALAGRTEGWAAGLQLAALALQAPGREDAATFVAAFAGSHRYVAEYLVEEVLKRQPSAIQTFLLQTSILDRLSAPLCEAVTKQQAGQATLSALHRANLFVIPLDNDGRWFRYHHLFADLLQARLQQSEPEEVVALLHTRAADWYHQNGFEADAVRHALAAEDFERASAIVERAGQTLIFTDQYELLQNWLDALPASSFQNHPRLEIYRVLLELTKGTLDMTEQTLREKERLVNALPKSPENDRLRVEAKVYLALFLAFQNTSRAIRIAQEALDIIPEGNLKRRAFLFSALYRAYGMDGDYERGREAYVECLRLAREAGHYGMAANTTMIRAFDLCQYGKLDEAAHYCRLLIEDGSRLRRKVFYPAGPAYIGLGGIYLERHQLEKAEEYLEEGVELARQGGLYGLFTAYTQKARLLQAKGELDKALAELELLEQTLQRREFTLMARHVSIQLARGDRAAAAQLETSVLATLGDSAYARQLPLIAVEAFKLSLARLLIARGELLQAGEILDEIQATVEPGRRLGRLLEVHLLRALLLQKQQSGPVPTAALTHLEQALDLAEPAGFVLLFLEEGAALVPLLRAIISHEGASGPAKRYAWTLLEAFRTPPAAAPARSGAASVAALTATDAAAPALVESLTPREMEVLILIAAGDSNRAIAEKLFITVRTVKKHASNIYSKLSVSRRTEAVARARQLGLLPTDS